MEESGSQDGDSDSWEKVMVYTQDYRVHAQHTTHCTLQVSIPETTPPGERISVVERIFSLELGPTMAALQVTVGAGHEFCWT